MSPVKKVVAAGIAIGMFLPVFALAQTSTSSLTTLLEQIKALQAQIVALQLQQQTLMQQQHTVVVSFIKTLKEGSNGDDVRALQALLAADPSLYPEGLITGFFGPKTAQAVKRFQKKHGLENVGFVGPKTRKLLNELFGMHGMKWEFSTSTGTSTRPHDDDDDDDDDDKDKRRERVLCFINPAGNTVPLGWFRRGDDDHEGRGSRGERGKRNDRWIIRPCGNTGTTTPPVVDTLPPVISGSTVSNISSTGATASWNTNEVAVSKVYYATTTPVNLSTAQSIGTASSTTFHSMVLSGLVPSTTYYYVLESKDAANNTATTSTQSFATTATPDTTAPIISSVSVSAIATTTATVAWTTNEAATGKVYYATTSPVSLLTALTMSDGAFSTDHSFGLTSLSASTTYFYVLESKDAANNTATTSAQGFTTTN